LAHIHDHHHHDDHPQGECCGHGPGNQALAVIEEPLDPANQSLSDALRLSFWFLKLVMFFLVIGFMLSGLVCVDQGEVVLVTRLGRLDGDPRKPGLSWAWPYPIGEKTKVSTTLRNLSVDSFWLNLSEADKAKSLSEVYARSPGLDPKVDGALLTSDLTGDLAIMHMQLNIQYRVSDETRVRASEEDPARRVSDVILFALNVSDEQDLLRGVIQNAAVAEAAKTTVDVLWKDAGRVASAVQVRAQTMLDQLETGIQLEKVAAPQSYFPLQAREEFNSVTNAMNQKSTLISEADGERTKKLLGVAGPAWQPLSEAIQSLDQATDAATRDKAMNQIDEILEKSATGEAGGKIKLAQRDREKVIADTLAEVSRFQAYQAEYRKDPQLVRKQLRAGMLRKLFDDQDVIKWWLPPGNKQLIISINKDPKDIRDAERRRLAEEANKPK